MNECKKVDNKSMNKLIRANTLQKVKVKITLNYFRFLKKCLIVEY